MTVLFVLLLSSLDARECDAMYRIQNTEFISHMYIHVMHYNNNNNNNRKIS